jgi:FAD/FMN-containing dehydrogenase
LAVRQQAFDVTGRNGLAEIESLHLVATRIHRGGDVLGSLNALNDSFHFQLARQARHRVDNRHAVAPFRMGDVTHEGAIDLDLVEGKAAQVAERRVRRTEIVKRDADPEIM